MKTAPEKCARHTPHTPLWRIDAPPYGLRQRVNEPLTQRWRTVGAKGTEQIRRTTP